MNCGATKVEYGFLSALPTHDVVFYEMIWYLLGTSKLIKHITFQELRFLLFNFFNCSVNFEHLIENAEILKFLLFTSFFSEFVENEIHFPFTFYNFLFDFDWFFLSLFSLRINFKTESVFNLSVCLSMYAFAEPPPSHLRSDHKRNSCTQSKLFQLCKKSYQTKNFIFSFI